MDNVLLDLKIIQIKWYSFFILLAIVVASILILKETRRKKLPDNYVIDILFYGIIFGILGARIYYVIFNIDYYLLNIKEILMIWNGGLAIHGGIISTLIFLVVYSKKKKINLLLLLDIIVVGLIIAQSIGRWGNFFNGEAYGRIVDLQFLKNLHLPNFIIKGMFIDGHYREPTFLYESIFSFIGFIILLIMRKISEIKTGQLLGIYMLWYGIERIIIESFRSDSLMLGTIKIAQLVSLIFILLGLYFIIKNIRSKKTYKDDKLLI